jgi:hypothetical protein
MPIIKSTINKNKFPNNSPYNNPNNKEHNKPIIEGFTPITPRSITSQLPKHTSLITHSNDTGYNEWRNTEDSEYLTKEICKKIQFNDQTLAIQKQTDLRTTLGEGYVDKPHPAIKKFIDNNSFSEYTILGRLNNLVYYYKHLELYNLLVVPDDNYTTVLNKEFILCALLTNNPIFILIPNNRENNRENSLMSNQYPSVTANEIDTIILRLLSREQKDHVNLKIQEKQKKLKVKTR